MIVKHGGRFGLSDDSHGKQAVGVDYDRLADYLEMSGITEIYHLAKRGRDEGGVGARTVQPVPAEVGWRSGPFWGCARHAK